MGNPGVTIWEVLDGLKTRKLLDRAARVTVDGVTVELVAAQAEPTKPERTEPSEERKERAGGILSALGLPKGFDVLAGRG